MQPSVVLVLLTPYSQWYSVPYPSPSGPGRPPAVAGPCTFWPAEFLLKNQLITLWGFPCILFLCVSLAAFNIFSLNLIFVSLINMCLGAFLLGFILYRTLCTSWTWVAISFPMVGKFLTIISLNIFSDPFFFSSFSGTPII